MNYNSAIVITWLLIVHELEMGWCAIQGCPTYKLAGNIMKISHLQNITESQNFNETVHQHT